MNDDELDAIEAYCKRFTKSERDKDLARCVAEIRRLQAQPLTVPIESATPLLQEMHTEIRRLRDALEELEQAEAVYRRMHDVYGDDHMKAGRSWDRMRRAGDAAREALAPEATGEEQS